MLYLILLTLFLLALLVSFVGYCDCKTPDDGVSEWYFEGKTEDRLKMLRIYAWLMYVSVIGLVITFGVMAGNASPPP
jgi:hypothetical protein